MARFPSIDNDGNFESPEVQNQIKHLVTGGAGDIRVDTSVGTRVFVGDTMIHGDTGVRDISDLLHENWQLHSTSGLFRIHRENNMITLTARIQRAPDSPSQGIALSTVDLLNTSSSTLPAGFTPHFNYGGYGYAGTRNGFPLEFHAYGNRRNLRVGSEGGVGTWDPGDSLMIQTSWETTSDWPTSLPGVPG